MFARNPKTNPKFLEVHDGIANSLAMTGNRLKDEKIVKAHGVLQRDRIDKMKPEVLQLDMQLIQLEETEPAKTHQMKAELVAMTALMQELAS